MLKCFKKINKKETGVFAAGLLLGTAGIKLLSSKDAKKLYTNCTAAVLRAKECVLKTATTIQENAEEKQHSSKIFFLNTLSDEELLREIHECKSQYKKAEIIICGGQTGDEKKDFGP